MYIMSVQLNLMNLVLLSKTKIMKSQLSLIAVSFAVILMIVSATVEPKKHMITTVSATPTNIQLICQKYYKWGYTLKETIIVSGDIENLQVGNYFGHTYTASTKTTQLLLIFEK